MYSREIYNNNNNSNNNNITTTIQFYYSGVRSICGKCIFCGGGEDNDFVVRTTIVILLMVQNAKTSITLHSPLVTNTAANSNVIIKSHPPVLVLETLVIIV